MMKKRRVKPAKLSIVIPIHNSAKTIGKCLDAIQKSNYKSYEIIIVDDNSTDSSQLISSKYTSNIIKLNSKAGRVKARKLGLNSCKGDIVVNIDSDVVIAPNTLTLIIKAFKKNANISAITGMLCEKIPFNNFSSQYKNLYMNYFFSKLSSNVNFLYGSIFAIRKNAIPHNIKSIVNIVDDTEMGQLLIINKKKISLLKSLQVTHLKKYSLASLLKNDFIIPFEWAKLFIKHRGWKQFGENGTGYAHASKKQIISLLVSGLVFVLIVVAFIDTPNTYVPLIILFSVVWFYLNSGFLNFLREKRGFGFFIKSIPVTYVDDLIKLSGVISGSGSYFLNRLYRLNIKK